ncbi:MAG: hypothetical protein AABY22_08520 [Nanoarchaeota archaeon]
MKIQWRKVPSVTTGGKQYFYLGNVTGSSVVWNRKDKKYHGTLWGECIGLFNTVLQAKKEVQQKFDNNK